MSGVGYVAFSTTPMQTSEEERVKLEAKWAEEGVAGSFIIQPVDLPLTELGAGEERWRVWRGIALDLYVKNFRAELERVFDRERAKFGGEGE